MLLTVWIVMLASAMLARPALATTPSIVHREHFEISVPQVYGASCSGFEVLFTASGDITLMDFYDSAGALTRETVQFSFTGTLYNSTDLSKNLPYEGRGFSTTWANGNVVSNDMYQAFVNGNRVLLEAADFTSQHGIVSGTQRSAEVLCGPLS